MERNDSLIITTDINNNLVLSNKDVCNSMPVLVLHCRYYRSIDLNTIDLRVSKSIVTLATQPIVTSLFIERSHTNLLDCIKQNVSIVKLTISLSLTRRKLSLNKRLRYVDIGANTLTRLVIPMYLRLLDANSNLIKNYNRESESSIDMSFNKITKTVKHREGLLTSVYSNNHILSLRHTANSTKVLDITHFRELLLISVTGSVTNRKAFIKMNS